QIAIVLLDMGLMSAASEAAIEQMPSAISFAFSPYMGEQSRLVAMALERGHELLVSIPMEAGMPMHVVVELSLLRMGKSWTGKYLKMTLREI
ncbi:MAG: divergent polysaccharide deacetylase family protein, partial [Candidatus Thalassarchaeaceae archaeon]